jgi:hypothetical protein
LTDGRRGKINFINVVVVGVKRKWGGDYIFRIIGEERAPERKQH